MAPEFKQIKQLLKSGIGRRFKLQLDKADEDECPQIKISESLRKEILFQPLTSSGLLFLNCLYV